ncbi:hypothetical protein B1F79_01275 [Coxiella-like endosymbiont of Rhipicephalus sanguineus]|uniref:hypothetical protein n=1 Tax=Coxiella-like endosymbiont of Rhipicephalus sanguineus TaxID=1955402 RepID=UPI002041957A|nr:hypothetical protein [Coxiella-like endosymbiont of Rhipicephalus sanguineus]MBT8506338.1 hypothetical protein [Coxiella-like endosymbiont of Rhipicephalus sanguineus]
MPDKSAVKRDEDAQDPQLILILRVERFFIQKTSFLNYIFTIVLILTLNNNNKHRRDTSLLFQIYF